MQSLPVVVLTGFTDSPMIERVLHLKVNSVLVKGRASPAEILRALEASNHPLAWREGTISRISSVRSL
jgi:DNA-binding NarL/FixJ family response regulator